MTPYEDHLWSELAAAELLPAVLGAQPLPVAQATPAPVELCEDIHAALIAAYNVMGKALYKFDTRVERADVRNQRARLKALAQALESQHMRPRGQRFKQRGDV
jgi:hypothetical protein